MERSEAKKPRKRASKRTIARRKAVAAAARVEREAKAEARRAAEDQRNRERWQQEYDAETERLKVRSGQRRLQEAGVEWLMGYNTKAALLFEQYVRDQEMAVKAAGRSAAVAGDPTNITRHTPQPSKKEQKKLDEEKRLAQGLRYEVIPDPDHPNQNVVVESRRRKRPLEQAHHLTGIENFWQDVQAVAGAIRSPAFDDKVDKSGTSCLLPPSLKARQRLDLCRDTIGKNNWEYAVGYLVMNMGPTELHRRGGDQHTTTSARIREALDELCSFYDKAFRGENKTLEILHEVVGKGIDLILQGERDLNWPHQRKKRSSAA